MTPVAKASSGIDSYELKIFNGTAVRTFKGSGKIPSSFVWDGLADDGTRCADGTYSAVIKTVANSGTEAEAASQEFILDTVAPSIKISAPYTIFSPDGISSRQTVPVKVEDCSVETKWNAEIRNAKNQVVKTFVWNNSKALDFAWDGTDDSGNKAANGIYSLAVSSKDAAGNSGSTTIAGISLDARPVTGFVTAEYKGISPNADGILDAQKFGIKVSLAEGISSWKFDIVDSANSVVKTFSSNDSENLPATITWGGDTSDEKIAEGTFVGKLHVEYAKGNVVDAASSSFICTAIPPALSVRTAPKYLARITTEMMMTCSLNLDARQLPDLKIGTLQSKTEMENHSGRQAENLQLQKESFGMVAETMVKLFSRRKIILLNLQLAMSLECQALSKAL
ncbi:MAG: hypothetical protein L6V90_04600 [Treponema succinifaciens]|nr:MAG: hypothetical protein L6V90_04600 [Treponema succinifaciens]